MTSKGEGSCCGGDGNGGGGCCGDNVSCNCKSGGSCSCGDNCSCDSVTACGCKTTGSACSCGDDCACVGSGASKGESSRLLLYGLIIGAIAGFFVSRASK